VDKLRAGQVVAIDSAGERELHARKVSIIYQVSGRIDTLTGSSDYGVSGQHISLAKGAKLPNDAPLRLGDWVNVSGFRSQNGTISVTRIDRRDPGPVVLRGRLTGVPGSYRIGDLAVRLPPGATVASGQWVVAEGSYEDSLLVVTAISPDFVASDPTALFAPNIARFLIEGYAEPINGRIVSSSGWSVPASPQPREGGSASRLLVIDLQRTPDGAISTSGFRALPSPFGIPGQPSGGSGQLQPLFGAPPFGSTPGRPAGGPGFGGTMPGGLPGGGAGPMGGGHPGR
jgi:hypothetical protein